MQMDFLSGVLQLRLGERGTRVVKWSYFLPGMALLLAGVVLVALAQAGVIKDAEPVASARLDAIFTAGVTVFMAGTFVLTLAVMYGLWRRGWPRSR
jgi:hypothetical protein